MKKILCALLLCCLAAAAHAGTRGQLRKGGNFYKDQKYGSALQSYHEILKQNPADQRALFNAGNAYYRLREYTQAQQSYQQAAKQTGDYSQSALFNLGNAYYRAGERQKAIEAYKQAVLQDPADKEAIHNLQLVLRQEQQEKDNQNNNNNQDSDSDNQNQQSQNNQGAAPQQADEAQDEQNPLSKSDAQRVLNMAKENEYKRAPAAAAGPEQLVEKDW